jgi:hypothetical protein
MGQNLRRLITLLVAAGTPATAGAQWVSRPYPSVDPLSRRLSVQEPGATPSPGAGPAIGFSAVGGVAGLVVGYAIGYPLIYQPDRAADLKKGCEDCGLGGALGAAALMALGETVGIAVGAHLGNARRGSLEADLWTSLGALALGAVVAGGVSAAGGEPPAVLVAPTVPIVQIAAVVTVERHTRRANTAGSR